MTTATRAKRRIHLPTVDGGSLLRGPVDIRTEGRSVIVTLDLPGFLLPELQWEIGGDSLVVRSVDATRGLHLPIRIGGPLFAARFIVVVTGTIFDVRMERHEP